MGSVALRALSLCSGIGGLDLGLARWCRTVCYVERDAFAASVLVARMEEEKLDRAPVWDDLKSFDGRRWRGAVDIVVGGYPCQPFSAAGKRLGSDDERHLWPWIARILEGTGAPLAFFENVRGHLSLGFADVLADLASLGFDAEWTVLGADDVGAPHRRDRLFVLAHSRSYGLRGRAEHNGHAVQDAAERAAGSPEPDGRGELVGDAERTRCGDEQREVNAALEPRSRFAPVGDSGRERGARLQPVGLAGSVDSSTARNAGEAMGDAEDIGRERIRGARGRRHGSPIASWPPGPSDRDGWRDYIERGGPQPVLRRGVDGPAAFVDRADRLRCLGNAVVPAQAERAFEHLLGRLP